MSGCQASKAQLQAGSRIINITPWSYWFGKSTSPFRQIHTPAYRCRSHNKMSRPTIPVANTSSKECAQAFTPNWIARFRVPLDMSSDRGSQFTSALWKEITTTSVSSYTEQLPTIHNQIVLSERLHRTLKTTMKSRLGGLIGFKNALGAFGAKDGFKRGYQHIILWTCLWKTFVSARRIVRPAFLNRDPFHSLIKSLSLTFTSHHGLSTPTFPHFLQAEKFLFIRRDCHRGPFQRPYDGPFRGITPGLKTFRVLIGDSEEVISKDRFKPTQFDKSQPVATAQPRRRERRPVPVKQDTLSSCSARAQCSDAHIYLLKTVLTTTHDCIDTPTV